MYLFDYTDSFLPFIHVTVPVLDNIAVVDLNTFQVRTFTWHLKVNVRRFSLVN